MVRTRSAVQSRSVALKSINVGDIFTVSSCKTDEGSFTVCGMKSFESVTFGALFCAYSCNKIRNITRTRRGGGNERTAKKRKRVFKKISHNKTEEICLIHNQQLGLLLKW